MNVWLVTVLLGLALGVSARRCPLLRAADSANKTGCYIIVLREETSQDKVVEIFHKATNLAEGKKVYGFVRNVLKAFTLNLSAYSLNLLQETPEISYIEEETVAQAAEIPISYHLDRVDQRELPLDGSYNPIGDGEGVDIYVLDSGVFYEHDEFENRAKFAQYDPMDRHLGENRTGRDCYGHGTHVASNAAGRTYGTAKKATVYSVRVLDCEGFGTWSVILEGLDYAMRVIPTRGRPAVVSVSVTGGYTQSVNDAIKALYKYGVPVVVAAGNYASDACRWSPASAPNAITVAGSAEGDRLYSKTNYGPCIDIFAPGHNVQGANHECSDCYQFKSGTSFAAPLVSGAVAIMLQRQPRLTPDQILYQLISLSTNNTLDTDSIPANFTSSTPNRLLFIPESCGRKISIGLQSVITIESPNYPLNYFKKMVCKWLITGPLNTYVRILFTNFSTEPFYDRIELYQGTSCDPNITQLATLSGKRDELAFTQCDSLSNSLLVEFKTDSLISDTGFRANILVAQTRQKQTVVVGLEESTYLVNEDEGRVKVCVAISNLHTCCPVTHNFSLTLQHTPGSATVGSDYIFDDRRSTIQFGTCDKRKCFFIGMVNNHQVETDESFTLTLVNNSFESDIELAMMSANVTILDNDVASVGLEHTDYSVEEGQEVRVCARLMTSRGSCIVSFPFSVVVNTEYGSAVSPEDYVTVSNESLSFPHCTTKVCFNITTHDDTLPEGNEEFHVTLSRGPDLNSRIHLDHIMNMAVVTILDDDAARVGIQNQSHEVAENEQSVQVCAVVLSPHPLRTNCPLDFSFSVRMFTSSGTAGSGSDYVSGSMLLRFGSCAKEVCRSIRIINDVIMELLVEEFLVSLETFVTDSRVSVSAEPSTVRIIDDDGVTLGLERTSYGVGESDGVVLLCVEMLGESSLFNAVLVSTVQGTAGSPLDFTPTSRLLTFEPYSSRMCITIDIVDDAAVENTESFTVSLSRTGGLDSRVQLRQPTSTIEITDDDTGATVELVTGSLSVAEGHVVSFCAVVSIHDTGCAVAFDFNISLSFRGSAEATVDYGNIPMAYTVPACQNLTCVNMTIVDDDIVEKDETIEITGSVSDRRIRMTGGTKVITITDNDNATVRLRTTNQIAQESDAQTRVCAVVIRRRNSISFPFDVKFTFTPKSAEHRYDFETEVAYGKYDPDHNQICVRLEIVDSADLELPESLLVEIELRERNPVIRISPDMSVGYIQIMDDDIAVIGLERTAYYLNSGSDDVQVCVLISRPTPSQTSCPISFPFDIIFRLSTEAADVFEVDETQTLSEGHGIERVDLQDSVLLYNSCQRKFCFDVSLKIETRPERGERFTISVERSPDHGRSIVLDSEKMSGFIQI